MRASTPPTGPEQGDQVREPPTDSVSGLLMAALIAIGVFIAAIFLLNLVEFGRLD